MALREFFPPLDPYATGTLKVDDIHTLYWEECGNPEGVPVVFLHGGPGAGATPTHRRFFDPAFYRIIIFDQRGAGRSRPLGEVRNNTTWLLIEDIETLRRFKSIERWHVFGGSWGSTLAIAYAEQYPERCISLALRGICLMQKREIDWFLYGIQNVFPEAWHKFSSIVPQELRNDLLSAYIDLFNDVDEKRRIEAVRTWAYYESSCSLLMSYARDTQSLSDDQHCIGIARIEAHYFKNNLFTPDSLLLDNIGRIRHIPAAIVQGRYDMICPMITADELHRAWPEAEYRIIPDAGHSALEHGIRSALIDIVEKFKSIAV